MEAANYVKSKSSLWESGIEFKRSVMSSSTRAELAGAIVGLLQQRQVHIATDNQGVVDKPNAIIQQSNQADWQDGVGKRPWALQKNGDLWQTLSRIIDQRGPQSMHISWCKGHATMHHIAANLTTARDATFNGLADATANRGHSGVVGDVFRHYAQKQKSSKRR